MKRWLGKAPPSARAALPTLAYAETCAVVIDTDADMDVPRPTGGNGMFVKRGVGTATIPRLYDGDVQSFSVEGGTLAVNFGDPGHDALYHVDASDVASLEGTTETRADGTVQTNVTRWLDVRRNREVHQGDGQPGCRRPDLCDGRNAHGRFPPGRPAGGLSHGKHLSGGGCGRHLVRGS